MIESELTSQIYKRDDHLGNLLSCGRHKIVVKRHLDDECGDVKCH